ncbi:hypothetical protein HK100_008954, partial [Physocladia obscura]
MGIFGEKKNGSQDAMQIDEDSLTPKIKVIRMETEPIQTTADTGAQVHGYTEPLPLGAKIISKQTVKNKSVIGISNNTVKVNEYAEIVHEINNDQGRIVQTTNNAMYYGTTPFKKFTQIASCESGGEYKISPPEAKIKEKTLMEIMSLENAKIFKGINELMDEESVNEEKEGDEISSTSKYFIIDSPQIPTAADFVKELKDLEEQSGNGTTEESTLAPNISQLMHEKIVKGSDSKLKSATKDD